MGDGAETALSDDPSFFTSGDDQPAVFEVSSPAATREVSRDIYLGAPTVGHHLGFHPVAGILDLWRLLLQLYRDPLLLLASLS